MADLCRALGIVPRGANYETVRRFAAKIGLDLPQRVARYPNPFADLDDVQVRRAIAESESIAGTLRLLGIPERGAARRLLKQFLEADQTDVTHWKGQAWAKGKTRPPRIPLAAMLVAGRRVSGTDVRRRLITEGLKEHRCERCQRREWCGAPIPLELDHVNGDAWDNRIENLRLLCPNCHALTPTYRGRNIGRYGSPAAAPQGGPAHSSNGRRPGPGRPEAPGRTSTDKDLQLKLL
ncbi:MAG TPA: HNH endonuclease [Egicoccus sp.]|nr:HNH endonuclease [Egicoccus sp.]HSK21618.1 HNH endonuclease [Egicoccus sp.]